MDDYKDSRIGVDIVQPRIAHYRLPLYQGLKQDPRLDIKIQASKECFGNKSVAGLGREFDLNHRAVRIFGSSFIWQKGLRLIKARKKGDVLVVCGDLHFLSIFPLILKARLKGVAVIWWGHHLSANARPVLVRIRLIVAKICSDIMLCYTAQGREYLVQRGFSPKIVFSTGNTIDQKAVSAAVACWGEKELNKFKEEHGMTGKRVLLFCSVLRKKTNLEVLLRAIADEQLKEQKMVLVIIGDGETREDYEKMASSLGVEASIMWLGAITEQKLLAPWFLSADIFVYPGAIGLSLLHAFAYGLPVITHSCAENHGPEFVVFEDGVNGMAFEENNSSNFASKIKTVLCNHELQKKLSANAWKQLHEIHTMEKMIANFKKAIIYASGCKCF